MTDKAVNILKSWIQGHHKSPDIMRFEKDDGTFTVIDEEIVEILSKHFHTVFNSNVKIDWSVVDELIQRKTYSSMNLPLSKSEFNKAIIKLILHKSPGANGISPNAIKALNDENKSHLFKICYDYFEDNETIEDWQIECLKILPKKGNLSNPNNSRGINLLDVVSKIMSLVITARLQYILKSEATPVQFGASPKLDVQKDLFRSNLFSNCVKNTT